LHYCDFEKKKEVIKMKKAFHFSIQCKDIPELFQRTSQIPLIIYGTEILKARGKGRVMINKN
jgi:hypothetical protein